MYIRRERTLSALNKNRTYDLRMRTSDASPMSYRRQAGKLGRLTTSIVTNFPHAASIGVWICNAYV